MILSGQYQSLNYPNGTSFPTVALPRYAIDTGSRLHLVATGQNLPQEYR